MKTYLLCMTVVGILVSTACGGGKNPSASVPADPTSLVYTNPTAAKNEWQLLKDVSSTKQHLVLNLVGPSDGSKYRGVGLTLEVDQTKIPFGQVTDESGKVAGYYLDGGVLKDKNPNLEDVPVNLQAGGIYKNQLMVGLFQRTDDVTLGANGASAKDCNKVVLQVAIDFPTGGNPVAGSVPIQVVKAQVIPENIGKTPESRRMQPVTVRVGTLELR